MKNYSLDELSSASTYTADAELATLARRVAEARKDLDLPTGDRKRLALSGGMAQAVFEALHARQAEKTAQADQEQACRAALSGLALPPGWVVVLGADFAEFSGPKDETLNTSLRRHGSWDPGKKVWQVPVSSGQTLARSLKRAAGLVSPAARKDRVQERRRRQDIQRWIGFVEEAAREGRVYARGVEECQARGVTEFADLNEQLAAALVLAKASSASVAQARQHEELLRWLGYVEEAAREGRVYQRGVTECRTRGIAQTPELEQRLAQALAQASQASQARQAQRPQRVVWPLRDLPSLNRPCRLAGQPIVYTEVGKAFRISDDMPSLYGARLLGFEGEQGAYVYYRAATDTETAELVEAERVDREEQALARQRETDVQAVLQRLCRPENLPDLEADTIIKPAGTVIHDARRLGGLLLLVDGKTLWGVQPNGLDGDEWSRNNWPGAQVWHSRDADLVARAKALAPNAVYENPCLDLSIPLPLRTTP